MTAASRAAPRCTDDDGTRRATLLFAPGTGAHDDAARRHHPPLDDFHVRATEYTVGATGPAAMPGELPPRARTRTPSSTRSTRRSPPARPASTSTRRSSPTRTTSSASRSARPCPPATTTASSRAGCPAPNGRVIEVAGRERRQGRAGRRRRRPTALGIDDAELRAARRAVRARARRCGASPVTHFTPWDFNWGFGLPPDARSPYALYPELARFLDRNCDDCGSVIGTEDQTYGEELELPGVPFDLHYQSARQQGRRDTRRITVQVTGERRCRRR